ncbi:MAG: hypothetical protein A4E28_00061 [Methanocella sp. PtaU1.Bin125]|nr:MAG: hypothetical protein A4E28_00061 [Methanocella sp. PtaU1.Bin125]
MITVKNLKLSLAAPAILVLLVLAVSGCIINNGKVTTPAPTPTPTPTPASMPTVPPAPTVTPLPVTTPAPTPTPSPEWTIVGLWEGNDQYMSYSMEFFADGKLIYEENRIMASGGWIKINDTHYLVGVSTYDTVVTLNDRKNQFVWGEKQITFTKRT